MTHAEKELLKKAIYWIAWNDDPEDISIESVAGNISTILIADTFDITAESIARRVVKIRLYESGN